jgi:hypothetical protein
MLDVCTYLFLSSLSCMPSQFWFRRFFIICHWVLLVLLRCLLLDFLQKKFDIDNWALFCHALGDSERSDPLRTIRDTLLFVSKVKSRTIL